MSKKEESVNPLDEVIEQFFNDHVELFYAIWQYEDMPSDADMDAISDAWYDEHEPDIAWADVEERMGELAMEHDWDIVIEDQPRFLGWDEDDEKKVYPGHIMEPVNEGEEE